MLYVGIDPGVAITAPGAIAVIDDNADFVDLMDIPVIRDKGKGLLSIPTLHEQFRKLLTGKGRGDSVFLTVLEQPLMIPGQRGVYSTSKAFHGWGVLEGMLTSMALRYINVRPAAWKKEVVGDKAADKGKSLKMATTMFPGAAKLLTRKKDHNRAEALLMAFYALTKSGRVVLPREEM